MLTQLSYTDPPAVYHARRLHRSPRDIRLARREADPDDITERVWEFGVIEPGSLGDCPATLCCDGCGTDVTEGCAAWSFRRSGFHSQLYHFDCWREAMRAAQRQALS